MDNIENYQKDRLTIDLVKANAVAIIGMIPVVLIFGLPYYLIWGFEFSQSWIINLTKYCSPQWIGVAVIFIILLGIVLHELIHGITWSRYTTHGIKSIRFGVLWKMLTPYCHCKEPLRVKEYIKGAVMPALVMGLLPGIVAIVFGNVELLIFSMFFTITAIGDFMIINLLKNEDMDDYVLDHPSEPGCFIFRKKVEE